MSDLPANKERLRPSVTFTLRRDNLDMLDALAEQSGLKRSTLLDTILDYFAGENNNGNLFSSWVRRVPAGEGEGDAM